MDTTVVKVGGSLQSYPAKLRCLCDKLSELSRKHRLIVVPGGGEFADAVRKLDRRFGFSPAAAHRMAVLGMDQYGLMLADLLEGSCTVDRFERLLETLDSGELPVFLPSNFMFTEDPLENCWDVTSDSIAVYVAGRLQANRAVLITDVNGVYTSDPKVSSSAKLIKKLSAHDLSEFKERTSVDKYLPKLLLQLKTKCFIVNGLYPNRVEALLNGQDTVYTEIENSSSH